MDSQDERSRIIFDQASDAFFISSRDGRLLDANPAGLRLVGYTIEELRELPLVDLVPETDRTTRPPRIAEVRSGKEVRMERDLRHKDGSRVPVEVRAQQLGNGQLLAICRDISERRRNDEVVRRLQSLLLQSERMAHIGSWAWDLATNAVEWSPEMYRQYEIDPQEVPYPTFETGMSRIHPDDLPKIEDNIRSGLAGGPMPPLQYRLRLDDGRERHIQAEGELIYENGKPAQMIGVVHDRTDEVIAAAALEASEERFKVLAGASFEGLAIHDEGRIVEVNDRLCAMLSTTRAELIGRNVLDFAAPDSRETIRSAVVNEHPGPYEVVGRTVDGRTFNAEIQASRITHSGRPMRLTAVRDISSRKETERALERAQTELAHAQKMQAIGQLAGGIAHDFNNLLTAILGNGELLTELLGPDHPARRHVQEMVRASDRATKLVAQLLAFGRKQVLQPRVLDLNQALQRVEPLVSSLLGETIAFVTRYADDLPKVRFDPGQLSQVLLNLAANARDAMPEGGQLLLTTSRRVVTDEDHDTYPGARLGSHAVLTVSDTGQGFDPSIRSHIFEPFFTTKEQGKGTGLGLASVYGIIKQSGGDIWAFSSVGEGARFEMHLPALEGAVVDSDQPQPVVPAYRGTETILLAEDDDAVRRYLTEALQRAGYTVIAHGDPTAALAVGRDSAASIELLLTDVVMPRLTGHALARELLAARPGLKVIFMSGYAQSELGEMLGAGVSFLQKPVRPRDVLARVREELDRPSTEPRPSDRDR